LLAVVGAQFWEELYCLRTNIRRQLFVLSVGG